MRKTGTLNITDSESLEKRLNPVVFVAGVQDEYGNKLLWIREKIRKNSSGVVPGLILNLIRLVPYISLITRSFANGLFNYPHSRSRFRQFDPE